MDYAKLRNMLLLPIALDIDADESKLASIRECATGVEFLECLNR